jgi:DNA polymerase III delta subunit
MIIFLYGPDDYRRQLKKVELIGEFTKKRSTTGLDFFNLENGSVSEELTAFLANQSIFETSKLAVIENAFEVPAPKLAKLLKPLLDIKNVTLLITEKDKPVKALAFLLEKPAIAQKFEALSGVEWTTFIKTEAKKLGVKFTDAAVQFLADVYQGNSWGVITELQKLASFAGGTGTGAANTVPIDKKDLNVFDLEIAPNYWGLMNGLKSYDLKNRLYAFESMLALGDPAAKIFNILASQWQEKTPHMAEYDLAVKSGKVDYEEALVDLLIS